MREARDEVTLVIPDVVGWAAFIGAVAALLSWLFKGFKFVKEPEELREEIAAIKEEQNTMKEELKILTSGILACLKGLHEQGANGPVTAEIKKIEDHMNESAHK